MKYCLGVLSALLFFSSHAPAQTISSPFAVDVEAFYDPLCNPSVGCDQIDKIAALGAHTIRIFANWHDIQPNSTTYNWGYLPWQVWYASQQGIGVYFTGSWAPQWANGASSTCPPWAGANQFSAGTSTLPQCASGYGDVGYVVTNSTYTYNFFYNLALQFNGSNTAGCSTNTVATCRPLVQYFGVWNEPNGLNNFWDVNYDPSNLGNYLNDFVTQYLYPAYTGVKAANPSAYVAAPEVSTGGTQCGGFSGCGSWKSSWMQALNSFFSAYYDIVTIHGYQGHTNDKTNVDTVASTYDSSGKPIWMTEERAPSSEGTAGVSSEYTDRFNRSAYWKAIFYSSGGYAGFGNNNCPGSTNLLCNDGSSGGNTLTITPYGSAYIAVYAPH